MIISSNVRNAITTLERLGIEPPAEAVEAMAVLTAAREAALVNPANTLGQELLDGTLTTANVAQAIAAAASDLAARDHANALAQGLEGPATRRALIAFREEGDRILLALRVPFDEAARQVEEAAKYVGPEATAQEAARSGSGALAAYESLREQVNVLNTIRGLRVTLMECGYGDREQSAAWYVAGVEDLAALALAEGAMTGIGNAFHRLAWNGFRLRLNTPAEALAVKRGAQAVTDKRQAAEEEARLAAHRKEWKPYLDAYRAMAPGYRGEGDAA